MKAILLGLALAAGVAAPAVADWQRQGQATGPRGNSVQSEGRGSCANGRCEWIRESERSRGGGATMSGTATRSGSGEWSASSTTTGSGGREIKREGGFQVIR